MKLRMLSFRLRPRQNWQMSVLKVKCIQKESLFLDTHWNDDLEVWNTFELFFFLKTNISKSHLVFFFNKRRPVRYSRYVPKVKINDGMFKSSKNIPILHTFLIKRINFTKITGDLSMGWNLPGRFRSAPVFPPSWWPSVCTDRSGDIRRKSYPAHFWGTRLLPATPFLFCKGIKQELLVCGSIDNKCFNV